MSAPRVLDRDRDRVVVPDPDRPRVVDLHQRPCQPRRRDLDGARCRSGRRWPEPAHVLPHRLPRQRVPSGLGWRLDPRPDLDRLSRLHHRRQRGPQPLLGQRLALRIEPAIAEPIAGLGPPRLGPGIGQRDGHRRGLGHRKRIEPIDDRPGPRQRRVAHRDGLVPSRGLSIDVDPGQALPHHRPLQPVRARLLGRPHRRAHRVRSPGGQRGHRGTLSVEDEHLPVLGQPVIREVVRRIRRQRGAAEVFDLHVDGEAPARDDGIVVLSCLHRQGQRRPIAVGDLDRGLVVLGRYPAYALAHHLPLQPQGARLLRRDQSGLQRDRLPGRDDLGQLRALAVVDHRFARGVTPVIREPILGLRVPRLVADVEQHDLDVRGLTRTQPTRRLVPHELGPQVFGPRRSLRDQAREPARECDRRGGERSPHTQPRSHSPEYR